MQEAKRKALATDTQAHGLPLYNRKDEKQPERVYPFELLSAARKDGGKCGFVKYTVE